MFIILWIIQKLEAGQILVIVWKKYDFVQYIEINQWLLGSTTITACFYDDNVNDHFNIGSTSTKLADHLISINRVTVYDFRNKLLMVKIS